MSFLFVVIVIFNVGYTEEFACAAISKGFLPITQSLIEQQLSVDVFLKVQIITFRCQIRKRVQLLFFSLTTPLGKAICVDIYMCSFSAKLLN